MNSPSPLGRHEPAAQMAANSVMSYLDECSIQDYAEKHAWVDQVFAIVRFRIGRNGTVKVV